MDFDIDDFNVGIRIFGVSEYQNSLLQLLENEKHNSDTCSWENV